MATSESHKKAQAKYVRKPEIREARKKLNKDWIAKNRDRYNKAKSEYRFKIKMHALSHYSNGTMSCAMCGYANDVDALCLDHINDDGAEHRKSLGVAGRGTGAGTTMYERLRAMGWQEGLQVLCANCNTIKEIQRKRGATSVEMIEATKDKIRWKK